MLILRAGVEPSYGLGDRGVGIRVSVRTKFATRVVKTGFGVNSASCPMGTYTGDIQVQLRMLRCGNIVLLTLSFANHVFVIYKMFVVVLASGGGH
jgi:hypothetical protein